MRKFVLTTILFTFFIAIVGCGSVTDDFDDEAFVTQHAPIALTRLGNEATSDGITDYEIVSMEWMAYTIEGSTDEHAVDVQVVIYHITIESDEEEHRYIFEYHTGEEDGEQVDGWQNWPSYIFETFPEMISFIIDDLTDDLDPSITFSHETGEFSEDEINDFQS